MAQYTIHEMSQRFGLPASTLRYYEEAGLLCRVEKSRSGQRIYTDEHVGRLGTINCLKRTGMTISQVKTFFACEERGPEGVEDILALLEGQKESVERQMDQLKMDYAHIQRKLRFYTDVKRALETGGPQPVWEDYGPPASKEKDKEDGDDGRTGD